MTHAEPITRVCSRPSSERTLNKNFFTQQETHCNQTRNRHAAPSAGSEHNMPPVWSRNTCTSILSFHLEIHIRQNPPQNLHSSTKIPHPILTLAHEVDHQNARLQSHSLSVQHTALAFGSVSTEGGEDTQGGRRLPVVYPFKTLNSPGSEVTTSRLLRAYTAPIVKTER